MCGIAGFVDFAGRTPGQELGRIARAMGDRMAYRGPDADGVWTDPAAQVALAHRRLAIVDLSAEGLQPMHSASGRYVITYNGEVYNFPTLRDELVAKGCVFRGHSDTEVMLAAIEAWGLSEAVGRFVGMFAFVLWDRKTRALHLVRDRMGVKPLSYGRFGDVLVFGSDLHAFAAHPAFRPDIDGEAVGLYLLRAYLPGTTSIYRQVKKVPPGAIVTLGADGVERTDFYWRLSDVAAAGLADPFRGGADEAADALEALLKEAVRLRLVSDVPLGVFLSGGVDSSTVAALMAETGPRVKSFTIGFEADAFDEAAHARAVARHIGADHTEFTLTSAEAMAAIPRLAAAYDEPFADSSQLPTLLVSEMARRKVTVALSGDGGDELFAGYTRHLWCEAIARRTGAMPLALRRVIGRALAAVSPERWDAVARALAPITPERLRQRDPGDKIHKVAAMMEADDARGMYRALVSLFARPEGVLASGRPVADPMLDSAAWPRFGDLTSQLLYLDATTYLPDDILTKVDRASMAVSLEAREPLLDHRVVALAWRLPLGHKIRQGRGKAVLRDVLYRRVPRALIDRPKWGFAVPIGEWLRGPLRSWAEDLLAPQRLAEDGHFDPRPVRALWDEHLSGRRNRHHLIWAILMFNAWLDSGAARAKTIDTAKATA
jgi:asparagine synthase (glutamine-hydrolysing)